MTEAFRYWFKDKLKNHDLASANLGYDTLTAFVAEVERRAKELEPNLAIMFHVNKGIAMEMVVRDFGLDGVFVVMLLMEVIYESI